MDQSLIEKYNLRASQLLEIRTKKNQSNERVDKKSRSEGKKKKGDNDHNNKGGGLLEPIIEDIGGWLQRKREVSPALWYACLYWYYESFKS